MKSSATAGVLGLRHSSAPVAVDTMTAKGNLVTQSLCFELLANIPDASQHTRLMRVWVSNFDPVCAGCSVRPVAVSAIK